MLFPARPAGGYDFPVRRNTLAGRYGSKFIEVFLNDIKGENLRNEIAHGLVKIDALGKDTAQILICLLLRLSNYKIVKKE